jgi:hypothetical protein
MQIPVGRCALVLAVLCLLQSCASLKILAGQYSNLVRHIKTVIDLPVATSDVVVDRAVLVGGFVAPATRTVDEINYGLCLLDLAT